MTLRNKTVLSITATTLLMIAVVLLLSKTILLRSYGQLEDRNIHQNAEQVLRLLDDEIAKLESTLKDWAYWDDTYLFVTDVNTDYIENNLNESSIVNLNLNFMVFTDASGRIVFEKAVDLHTGSAIDFPPALLEHIRQSAPLSRLEESAVTAGIILLPDFPVLIASAPVLTSAQEGPAHGRMILGRFFDSSEIKRIADKLQLSLSVHRFDDQRLPEDLKTVTRSFAAGQEMVVHTRSEEVIEIFFAIKDIYGTPILFVGIDTSRAIYMQGRKTLGYFTAFVVCIGAVFMFVTTFLIEKVVLARLRKTSRQVNAIGNHGDFEARVALEGKDELACLATDINKMLDALQESTERDRNILDNIIDGYCELDLQGRILLANKSMGRITGFHESELLHKNLAELVHPRDVERLRQAVQASVADKTPIHHLDGRFQTRAGRSGYFDAGVNLITDNNGHPVGYRSIIRDVTEIKENEERLVYLAYHDPLTALYNRKAFMERLEEELAYAARYHQERVLLFIDLDKFKAVNDTFGHDTGDALLAAVAKRMRRQLRETDIIARMGGDEFCILLNNPERVSAEAVVKRVAEAIDMPYELDGRTIDFVSASIGVKRYPGDATTSEDLIKAADSDMYREKNRSRMADSTDP